MPYPAAGAHLMTDEPDDEPAPPPPHEAPPVSASGSSSAPAAEGDVTKQDEEVGRAAEPESLPGDPAVTMDEESPSEVRKTFIVLATLGGILLLLPRQY